MRRVFLWAARNRWLKEHLPRLRFMRRAVRRFMPGETLERRAGGGRCRSRRPGSARCTRGSARTSRTWPRPTRSPTTTSRSIDQIVAAGITRRDLGQADPARPRPRRGRSASPTSSGSPSTRRPTGSYLWIDMEGSAYVEATIALYETLCARSSRGPGSASRRTCAGRRPTSSGCGRSIPAIRLVKGAYDEPEAIAYRDRAQRRCQLRRAGRPLPARRPRPADPARPRDPRRRADRADRRAGRRRRGSGATGSRSRCCTASATRPAVPPGKAGYRVQALIAYGEHWYPWYMRRLAERPANVVVRAPPDAAVSRRSQTDAIAARMDTIGTESAFEVTARARALEAQGRSIVHLQIGEPDFDTPANVREAAKRALDAGATHYPPFAGIPALREAIAADVTGAQGLRRSSRRRCSSRSVARA